MKRDQEGMLADFEAEKKQLFLSKDEKLEAEGASTNFASERAELLDVLQKMGLDK